MLTFGATTRTYSSPSKMQIFACTDSNGNVMIQGKKNGQMLSSKLMIDNVPETNSTVRVPPFFNTVYHPSALESPPVSKTNLKNKPHMKISNNESSCHTVCMAQHNGTNHDIIIQLQEQKRGGRQQKKKETSRLGVIKIIHAPPHQKRTISQHNKADKEVVLELLQIIVKYHKNTLFDPL